MNKCVYCNKLTENDKFCKKGCAVSYSNQQRAKQPGYNIVCDKISKALINRKLSQKHKNNISKALMGSVGWSKGLTKESNLSVAKASEHATKVIRQQFAQGRKTWNDGLTKKTDSRLKRIAKNISKGMLNSSWYKTTVKPKCYCKCGKEIRKCSKSGLCRKCYAKSDSAKIICRNAGIKGGRVSVAVQSKRRRGKNEKYFASLCKRYFKNVETNKQLFNGWDADVIIHDIKVAVLWNGIWHYRKISKGRTLKQQKNRDRLKIEQIKECGYIPYTIKDMNGRLNKEFVKKKFKKFINRAAS